MTPCASSAAHRNCEPDRGRDGLAPPPAGIVLCTPEADGRALGIHPRLVELSAALPLGLAPLPLLSDARLLGGPGRLRRPPLLLDDERSANEVGEPLLGGLPVLLLTATGAR